MQRTLGSYNTTRDKRRVINKNPIWFVPEFSERNPIFRFVLQEKKEEYYLPDGTSKHNAGEAISPEQARNKILEVLTEAQRVIKIHLEKIDDVKERDVRERHRKYFLKYQKAIGAMLEKLNNE